jgi:light-regulated signal transduction histidine kinase (bacteriophytochrome)
VLPEGQIKQELIVSSYRPAVEFFEIMDKQIVPAILGGDKEKAHTLIRDVLTPKYEDHRRAIENVVRTANEAIRREERESDVIVKRRLILMVLLGMGVIGIALLYLRAEGALRKLLAELELRVEERTKQFSDANQSLLAANKELEGFSYSVSHDLRAPLRAINGFSMMVLNEHADKLDDEGRRKLNVIRSNTQQMGKLIDDLLSFSRLGRKEMANACLDMEVLVRRAWEELTTLKPERRIGFSVQRLPRCMGDQWLVKEAVVNLLSNAMKFTRHRENAYVEVGAYVEGDRNVYFVKDNGVGFDMRYYDKLFGVFQRLHGVDEFEGTGVGLAIVERIIARHGGRVWAEGKEGEGATFYFTLLRGGEG